MHKWALAGLLALSLAGGSIAASAGITVAQNQDQAEQQVEPRPGQLLLPGEETGKRDDEDQQCMTICARWGEECTYVNQGIAGLARKCRRTCQQTATECF